MTRKQIIIAVAIILVAVLGGAGIYLALNNSGSRESKRALEIKIKKDALKDSGFFGTITEDAVSAQKVSDATINVGGKSKTVKKGVFSFNDVPKGKQVIKIEAPGHEDLELSMDIKKSTNVSFVLLLTPEETIRRWFEAEKAGDYDQAYKYTHPDAQATYSKADYIKDRKNLAEKGMKLIAFTPGQTRFIESWTFPTNGKKYTTVAEVDITQTFGSSGKDSDRNAESTSEVKIHLVNDGNHWKNFVHSQ